MPAVHFLKIVISQSNAKNCKDYANNRKHNTYGYTTHVSKPGNAERRNQHPEGETYSLMGSGLHGENGQDPETALSLLQTYVLPILFYGIEMILPSGKALSVLDTQYKRLLK